MSKLFWHTSFLINLWKGQSLAQFGLSMFCCRITTNKLLVRIPHNTCQGHINIHYVILSYTHTDRKQFHNDKDAIDNFAEVHLNVQLYSWNCYVIAHLTMYWNRLYTMLLFLSRHVLNRLQKYSIVYFKKVQFKTVHWVHFWASETLANTKLFMQEIFQ